MTSRSTLHLESRAAVLERMAASRAELLAAQRAAKLQEAGRKPSLLLTQLPALISTAPTVSLLVAVILGSLIVGPRKIASVVVRNGLMAWIAKTVRRLAGR
jgi:hypothetical protein